MVSTISTTVFSPKTNGGDFSLKYLDRLHHLTYSGTWSVDTCLLCNWKTVQELYVQKKKKSMCTHTLM